MYDKLLEKINEVSGGSEFLISLTDHNTINKYAYLKLLSKTNNVLLGAELHIKNYKTEPPYHCHIIFNVEKIEEKIIDSINKILDELYSDKVVTKEMVNVPTLEVITRSFDAYDFILLPHGGQFLG